MAGAVKTPFPTWRREISQPFDPVFGSGQLEIDRSHRVLTEGNWRYDTIHSSAKHEIGFEVEVSQADASIVLIWNRKIWMKRGEVSSITVADMALRLYREDTVTGERELIQESDSINENREHVYVRGLVVGSYVMVLESDREVSYGLAWHLDAKPMPSLVWGGQSVKAVGLATGVRYEWQQTSDLQIWDVVETFQAKGKTALLEVSSSEPMHKRFYRLTWARSAAE